MVLSFNFNYSFIDLAQWVEREPVTMVIWSAFGVPFCIFVVSMLLIILRKLHLRKAFKTDTQLLLVSLIALTWVIGFITQIIMLFMQVSGLRMMLIWIIMVICYFSFLMLNRKMYLKWARTHSPFDK